MANQLSLLKKKIEDTPEGICTRSQEQKQELVKRADFNRYFRLRGRKNIKRWLKVDDSEFYERIRLFFSYSLALAGIFIIFIVNNGNIFTDGRRYRKQPRIEM